MRETTKIVAVILVLSAAAFSGDKEVTFDSIKVNTAYSISIVGIDLSIESATLLLVDD